MKIGAFSRATGLTPDTIRFYVCKGLLKPDTGSQGGRNPYQIFTAEHVRTATIIRMAQSSGMSLKEILAINDEYEAGGVTRERSIEIISNQIAKLEATAANLNAMATFFRAKLAWLEGGEQGPAPDCDGRACESRGSNGARVEAGSRTHAMTREAQLDAL